MPARRFSSVVAAPAYLPSELYLHLVYARMHAAGERSLDERHRVRAPMLATMVRESAHLGTAPDVRVRDQLEPTYRQLDGRSDQLAAGREQSIVQARQDTRDFALVVEVWEPLNRSARAS